MKRAYRLQDQRDFRSIIRLGKKREYRLFRVWALPNTRAHLRAAFVTPRAINKRATVRNSIRRRARERVRTTPALLTRPLDVIFFFKKDAAGASGQELREEVDRAIREILRAER